MINDFILTLFINAAVFSILFLFMLLIRKIFSKKISVFLQYMLWLLVVLKLVIPFGFESSFSILDIAQSPKVETLFKLPPQQSKRIPPIILTCCQAPEISEESINTGTEKNKAFAG